METLSKATHQGTLVINDFKIKSYVLDNGIRVLNRIEFIRALGRTGKAKGEEIMTENSKCPYF